MMWSVLLIYTLCIIACRSFAGKLFQEDERFRKKYEDTHPTAASWEIQVKLISLVPIVNGIVAWLSLLSLLHYRRLKRRTEQEKIDKKKVLLTVKAFKRIANDPDADEEDKSFAKEILGIIDNNEKDEEDNV